MPFKLFTTCIIKSILIKNTTTLKIIEAYAIVRTEKNKLNPDGIVYLSLIAFYNEKDQNLPN
jgi:hypothetical protein